jgi:glycosyltransferase involved in cell wall biosynthesis
MDQPVNKAINKILKGTFLALNPLLHLKIGVVDVLEKEGGRKSFIRNFTRALQQEGCEAKIVNLTTASIGELNTFDILCFSDHFFGLQTWKLFLISNPKKILTVHGWVTKETILALKHSKTREKLSVLSSLVTWSFIPSLFDVLTCPTINTARENNLKDAVIISNAVDPACLVAQQTDLPDNEILVVTYTSIGGLKSVAVNRVIKATAKLNAILKDKKIRLMIFGKHQGNTANSKYVSFMGYSDKFLEISKNAALFFAGYSFPDIGYTEMEMGLMGVPIAKFTEDYESEEIVDGKTGILAKDENEMVSKLLAYFSDVTNQRRVLGQAFQQFILENKSWPVIISKWNRLFLLLMSNHDVNNSFGESQPTS